MATSRDQNVLNTILNPMMPTRVAPDEPNAESDADQEFEQLEGYAKSRQLEIEGIQLSEAGDHESAVSHFDAAIAACPRNASAFNNRAQELQLLKRLDEARADLDEALKLSEGRGRAARQAFAQRGLLSRLAGDLDAARIDYQHAAQLGSKFARNELVTLNPYAAMCNAMLADVMTKLRSSDS